MYPHDLIPGVDLYLIMLCLGIAAAILIFRMLADRVNIPAKLLNFTLFTGAVSIVAGYYSAVLFQAIYNIKDRGVFEITSNTGATFYGGLIGGAVCFLLIYFVVGHFAFFSEKEHREYFFTVTDIAAASIAIAHSFGRLGCFFAGCCHGAENDGFLGWYMEGVGKSVIPLQLYEAIFLIVLFLVLVLRLALKKTYNLPIYMAAYGVWRFLIEYLRDDYRGDTFISFLSPSQLTAIFMVAGSAVLMVVQRKINNKTKKKDN